MEIIWYCLLAVLLTVYVVLDGFDLGAGAVSLAAAKTGAERGQILAAIGPFWDGNEVWLIAAGGTLFCAFPTLYAASFSGFYLPLTMVLWLLMLRGLAIEFRNHIDHPIWTPLWDFVFGASSGLLALVLGVALGNVIRGVPLDKDGVFFLPLWGETGVLDPYTLLTGLLALCALTLHGANWIRLKTEGELALSAARLARRAWFATSILAIAATAATFTIQPQVARSFSERPYGWIFPALAAIGLYFSRHSFGGSAMLLTGLMTSAAFGLFPLTLPAIGHPANSLTVYNSTAPGSSLHVALLWWPPAVALATAYFVLLYRRFAGKIA